MPGQSGNPRGRPKGTPNKATAEAKAVCSRLVDDPVYQAKLQQRLRAGKLAPAVECMLWHYAKGKPKEQIEVDGSVDWEVLAQRLASVRTEARKPIIRTPTHSGSLPDNFNTPSQCRSSSPRSGLVAASWPNL
jgi:hypothetical protein